MLGTGRISLLRAFVAIVKLSGYDACNCGAFSLSNVLAATLIMYQIFDYLYGEELMMSDEFALFRDLMEYVIGYVLVMVGSYMQKERDLKVGPLRCPHQVHLLRFRQRRQR